MFVPRESQKAILDYAGGQMAIAAVPGSGKTEVLSLLAARLVASWLQDEQEVLIVTLVNSAVENFAHRVRRCLERDHGLLAGVGYRVRTLHGLCSDMLHDRPGLVGLAEDFGIADELEAGAILDDVVSAGLHRYPDLLSEYLGPSIQEWQRPGVAKRWWPRDVRDVANAFIRRAKDRQWTPELLISRLAARGDDLGLARFCCDVYADYQRALTYRGKLDFDDLVRLAINAMRSDDGFLQSLRARWPFVLEDEAQDSSALQQELLALLTGPGGNWVRVGDTNQAVYQTFTTAEPRLLREFYDSPGVQRVEMLESGRCGPGIMGLANYLVSWTVREHPLEAARQAFRLQAMRPTPVGDPQPNPRAEDCRVYFHAPRSSPEEEVRQVADALARWVPQHRDQTAAVLVPDNERGTRFVGALTERGVECLELLSSASETRDTAGVLAKILLHLGDPAHPIKLASACGAYYGLKLLDLDQDDLVSGMVAELGKCEHLEDFGWPRLGRDWLLSLGDDAIREVLSSFRNVVQVWQEAAGLPIDQLVLLLAQDLFVEPREVALCYHLGVMLGEYAAVHPDWRHSELARELVRAARSDRRFSALSEGDMGFDPDQHRGRVVVATVHKAKGLEWDRVHLTAVNNYDFPASERDRFRSEPWYARPGVSPLAEALAQLEVLGASERCYVEGAASENARMDYVRERLRLLYVGITRARKELVVTWNSGKSAGDPKRPALAFTVLQTWWEQQQRATETTDDPS